MKQKKLMLLGGIRYLLPVIKKAHELGIYVITCDYLPDNIAHKYSDEYINCSILDKDAVLKKAIELEIDGITSFGCDPGVVTAAYVAEKMGLPSCGPYKSVEILQNKGLFRKFLTDNGFKVPVSKSYHNPEEALSDISIFHWPVIVKPTDSAGSKGVKKVENPDDLLDCINYALSYSHCNEFIVEDFLQKVGDSSDCDCFSVNGKLEIVTFSSQKFDSKAQNEYTPAAFTWPSSLSKDHISELSNELQRLLNLLNMGTSIYNVETRECTDGNAYIMEVSPRGGGNRLAEMVRYMNNVDMIENVVRSSVGLPLISMNYENTNDFWAEIILHSDKDGIFDKLLISDSIRDCIVEEDLWVESGTSVGGFKSANESIGTLILKFTSKQEMDAVLSNISDFVKIILK